MNVRRNFSTFKSITGNQKNIIAILMMGLLLLATFTLVLNVGPVSAVGPTPVPLGTAAYFSVLAGSGITNTGTTTITADAGTYPTPSETGFTGANTVIFVNGVDHADDSVTQGAKIDLLTAYNNAAGQGTTQTISADLGGQTLTAGVYTGSPSLGLTGTLTLDGQNNPNSIFIFQCPESTLTTATSSVVNLTNGAQACNVFWQVGSSATIGTSSAFVGNILALTSITLTTSATVEGRVLALNGLVTLDTNTINTTDYNNIVLTPASATNPVSTNHTVTATVAGTGNPVPGLNITFNVVSGPNVGLTDSNITDSNGQALFTYMSTATGTDNITASFLNEQNATVTSNTVTKTWTPAPSPAIIVVKQVSVDNNTWVDADLPPGILVTVGSNVYYRLVVTNIGNEDLSNITLTDNTYTLLNLIVPPTLAPNASFTYYLDPISAELGQYTNIATVTAQFNNANYTNTNNANYNGIPSGIPSISVVKEISLNNSTWVDANVPPGISVTVGSNVYYRFNVTNTGNVVQSNITLTDNTYNLSGSTIPSTLAPNASFVVYIGPIQAQVGQHTNTATATGQYNNITYSNTDNANYNASPTPGPSIIVTKWVSSDNITWFDANTPPGLNVTAGSNVYFKFEITNTGNVTLLCITLKDNTYKLVNLKLPSTLAPNATFTYYLGPIKAQVGQHTDTATATGKYNYKVYCDTDNANYYGTCAPKPAPKPTCTPRPTCAPTPTCTPKPTCTPRPTCAPTPTCTPKPTCTPRPTCAPTPTATPKPTCTPKPTPTHTPTQEQVRSDVMNYIKTYHRETAQYMQCFYWTGGLVNTGTLGTATYKYLSNGWTVTMTYPIVPNPVYTVTVTYERQAYWFMPEKVIVNWQGTWQNGAIRQTNYRYTP